MQNKTKKDGAVSSTINGTENSAVKKAITPFKNKTNKRAGNGLKTEASNTKRNYGKIEVPAKGSVKSSNGAYKKTGRKPAGQTAKNQSVGQSAKSSTQLPKKNKSTRNNSKKHLNSKQIRIGFLGGLNEIGKNITIYEYNNEIILVDCGLAFPEQDMLGVDIVIPDFTYLIENRDKIKAMFITHGHEDHIGGLAYLLKDINIPVYGTKLTIGLIEGKLKEHNLLDKSKLNVIKAGDVITLGSFKMEAIHVNHSIPDALAYAITTPAGVIIETGDFKFDSTPIDGGMIDLNRLGELGNQGVLCLLSDSTNAERPGFTESERKVGDTFENLFRKAENKRILVATFASNVHRVQQIIDVAYKFGRKVALSGRSLENVITIGSELGYMKIPEGTLVSIDMINKYPPENMVIVTTGSQGEPMSALTRMAFSDHRKVSICPNDYVIISASPIPGNEKTVSNVVNELMKLGAEVIYEKTDGIHVSGHACQEELKLMIGITKPKFFIPVHGEQKHLRKHAELAASTGLSKSNIYVADNGDQIDVSEKGIKLVGKLPAGQVFVDGSGVGDVGNVVLRDRKRLAEDGLVVIVASIDGATGEIAAGPDVISRGFVYVKESEGLMDDARKMARYAMEDCQNKNIKEWSTIKSRMRDEVSDLMYEKTKRTPMILSILMEV